MSLVIQIGGLRERCLFLFTTSFPEISLLGGGVALWGNNLASEVSGVPPAVLEKPRKSSTHTPDRTHNCTRPPRLAASGLQDSSR